ncbi:MAG: DUF2029 domain-containing protein [Cyanobacteria bacterium REEB67]|nr:DUF2029 domain-containing protein [Cyanobacteria bacterium REEB67]
MSEDKEAKIRKAEKLLQGLSLDPRSGPGESADAGENRGQNLPLPVPFKKEEAEKSDTPAPPPPPYLLLEPPPVAPEDEHSPAKDPQAFRPDTHEESHWDLHPSTLALRALDCLNITAVIAAAIIFLVGSGTVFYKHQFVAMRTADRLQFCDFAKYYVCGKIALSKEAHHAYDPTVQTHFLLHDAHGDKKTAEEFIHYPPIDFPLMAPLAEQSIDKSFYLFTLLGHLIFFSGTFLLARATLINRGRGKMLVYLLFWLAACASVPMCRAFMLGQTSLILTGLTAIYIWALIKNRSLPAGIALALTAIKPQYSIFLVIPALVQRRFKLLFFTILAEIALLFAAFKTIGLTNILNYPQIVMHAEQTANLAGGFVSEMVNVRGLLAISMADAVAVKIAGAVALAAWLCLAVLWLRYCPRPGRSDDTTFKLLLTATVMFCLTFSPHTHLYDCLFVSVTFLVAGQKSLTAAVKNSNSTSSWATRSLSILFLLYPLLGWFFLLMPGGTGAFRTAPFAVYNIALSALSVIALLIHKPFSKG